MKTVNKIRRAALMVTSAVTLVAVNSTVAMAQIQLDTNLPKVDAGDGSSGGGVLLTTILPIVFGFAGAIAVLMIAIGGFRYVISSGEPAKTAQAKNTIIYAIVGLVLAFASFAILRAVVGRI